MTALFVKTFLYWLRDDSPQFHNTRRWLDRGLDVLETAARLVPAGRFGGEETAAAGESEEQPEAGG